ncbi:hypothetical protein TNCV_654581 [Trichonephila clavipes]|nr:hypothetical protein TNCV_654581 [Trichonephila clavipes]
MFDPSSFANPTPLAHADTSAAVAEWYRQADECHPHLDISFPRMPPTNAQQKFMKRGKNVALLKYSPRRVKRNGQT